ncbi:hypothetical protein [Intestinibacter sp.]|uniref:hypothetical protein n=1 Tax=Intestinibacter sp. TaxID=1965304 RepID=UPI003F15AF97
MTDSLGKNLVVKTWNASDSYAGDWYPTFYDMDTVLGLNNTGLIQWRPNVDLDCYGLDNEGKLLQDIQDLNGSKKYDGSTFTLSKSFGLNEEEGKYNGKYNTTQSRLWDAIRTITPYNAETISGTNDTYKGNYAKLRTDNGVLTY